MLLLIARIASSILAIVVISRSLVNYSQRKESFAMSSFWIITWGLIVALSFYPSLLDKIIGEARVGIGTVMGIGLVFVYYVLYRIYTKSEKMERDLNKLIRDLSHREADDPEKGNAK